ncbi:MAG: hypothetical protein PHN41_03370 [Bacteroidales bacterium]|nr:hypothetical protein [Bacteroidales bacterium]MDD4703327.1 hypothetical protein [Bacteroidales bacterium]
MKDLEDIYCRQKNFYLSNNTRDISYRILMLKKLKEEIIKSEKEIEEALYLDLHKSSVESYIT